MGLVVIDPDFCCFGQFHGLPPSVKGFVIWAGCPREAYDIQLLNANSMCSLIVKIDGKKLQDGAGACFYWIAIMYILVILIRFHFTL